YNSRSTLGGLVSRLNYATKPDTSENLVTLSSLFTLIKSLLTVTYFTGLIMALCVLAYGKLVRRSKRVVS
ncbi:hypothetical protein, partial [Vibrio parahaemolyticus]|uniref:hypothetical protein n=1 Tax=Vibrio parahaemolyticus TaxID=670 RepID=UPI001C0EDDDC